MEPILVILLLFGAFTLGAGSADSQTGENTESASEQHFQDIEQRKASLSISMKVCLSGRHPVIYRDLSIPFTRQQTALPAPRESGCPDE